jgi:hypothetical protein
MSYNGIIDNIAHSGSTQLLAKLFGGNVYNIFGGGNFHGPQETMLTIFGSLLEPAVLWMYVALVVYVVLAGLVNKGQSGEFMLKSWNGFWPWVRMIFGLTAVAPSFAMKNLVTIQMLVLAVALIASSVADLTWRNVLDQSAKYGLSTQHVLAPSIDPSKTDAYLNDAFQYSTCVANKIKYDNTNPALTLNNFDPIHPDITAEGEAISKQCGGQKFLTFLKQARSEVAPNPPDLTSQPGTDLISSDVLAKFNQYQSKQFNYLGNQTVLQFIQNNVWPFYVNNMAQLSQSAVPDALAVQWQGILTDFHLTLKNKIQSAILADKGMTVDVFTSQVSHYGWISAANYYRQLAQEQQIINSQITSGLESSPNYVNMDQQKDLTTAGSMTKFHVYRAKSWLSKVEGSIESGATKYVLNPLGINFLKMGNSTDPILAMTNFGQKLEGTAEVLVVARQVPKLFSWIPVVGNKLSNVFSGGVMDTLVLILIAAGLVLGVILPNLPWIIFMFAIISWLVYVAEMFIAAPFWVVANALPEGGTILSNVAKKGFNNVLFIALFPTLAIGGLIASLSISWIGISLLNHYAYLAFKGLEGWNMPFDVVGIILIYVPLAWAIMFNSLSLIQILPRKILNWISLSQPGMNQFDSAHNDASSTIMGAVGVSGIVGRGAESLGNWEKSRALKHSDDARDRSLRSKATSDDNE